MSLNRLTSFGTTAIRSSNRQLLINDICNYWIFAKKIYGRPCKLPGPSSYLAPLGGCPGEKNSFIEQRGIGGDPRKPFKWRDEPNDGAGDTQESGYLAPLVLR